MLSIVCDIGIDTSDNKTTVPILQPTEHNNMAGTDSHQLAFNVCMGHPRLHCDAYQVVPCNSAKSRYSMESSVHDESSQVLGYFRNSILW
jgi:hypothetical protein